MAAASEIVIQNVTKKFGSVTAVNQVELTIEGGSYCCMIGPSGCGKTTLLRMIAGHDQPTSGHVLIGGNDMTNVRTGERGTALMFQNYALFPHLNLTDNVSFSLKIQKIATGERTDRAREMLDRVQLLHLADRYPSELSGGQQQRVAVARALASKPQFILADEPTANLDSKATSQLLDMMAKMNKDENATFVFATHDQRVMDKARRVVTLEDGVIVSDVTK